MLVQLQLMAHRLFCLAILSLLSVLVFSCSKGKDKELPPAPKFTITGLKDIDMSKTSTSIYSFPIQIQGIAGAVDTVTLYAKDQPGNVYISFSPLLGITPYTSIVTVSAQSQGAGTFPFKIVGAGISGVQTYNLNITLPEFRGWKLNEQVYHKTTVQKDAGNGANAPTILVNASGGAVLEMKFGVGANLPTSNRSYSISSLANSPDKMVLILHDGAHEWVSTGSGQASGQFTFEGGKFNFKCSSVDMADSTEHKTLIASFVE
jgi:hypothetical protein